MTDTDRFVFFVGIDWGSEAHQVCVLNARGEILGERQVLHTAVAIEVPRGPLVETLLERGFAVFSLNPKQLDRHL